MPERVWSGANGETWWGGGGVVGVESSGEREISVRELDTMGKDDVIHRKEG